MDSPRKEMYKAALSMTVERKPSIFHCFIDAATNCKTHLFSVWVVLRPLALVVSGVNPVCGLLKCFFNGNRNTQGNLISLSQGGKAKWEGVAGLMQCWAVPQAVTWCIYKQSFIFTLHSQVVLFGKSFYTGLLKVLSLS